MNVLEYFQKVLSASHLTGLAADEIESLESMPIDSNCGDDCKKALDACAGLINFVRQAFGDESAEEDEIVAATLSAVMCFICG